MINITINGNNYPLACNLRVAYVLQNQHNHKPYTQILAGVGNMTLEEQINVLYAAFTVANPEASKNYSPEMFRTMVLDDCTFNVQKLMEYINQIFSGILGADLTQVDDAQPDGDAKN